MYSTLMNSSLLRFLAFISSEVRISSAVLAAVYCPLTIGPAKYLRSSSLAPRFRAKLKQRSTNARACPSSALGAGSSTARITEGFSSSGTSAGAAALTVFTLPGWMPKPSQIPTNSGDVQKPLMISASLLPLFSIPTQ